MQKFFQNQQLIGRWWAEICEFSWPLVASISHQQSKQVLDNFSQCRLLFNPPHQNQLPANLGHSVTWNSLILLRLTFKNSVAQMVKNLPAMWESLVPSLGWEDPLSRAWQPTQVFLPGVSPWTEEPGRLKSIKSQRVRHDWTRRFLRLLERFEVSSLAGGNRQ